MDSYLQITLQIRRLLLKYRMIYKTKTQAGEKMKKTLVLAVCMVLFVAAESHADSLFVGGQYSSIASVVNGNQTTEGGGSVGGSSLNGKPLDYLYCVDLFTNVYVNASYPFTTFNRSGVIHGNPVINLEEVAWLLGHYGTGGQGDQAMALQAAIWEVINGYNVYHLDTAHSSASVVNLYNTMLTQGAGQHGNVSNFLWINPGTDAQGTQLYQGLVTSSSSYDSVPEPVTMLLFGSGLICLAGMRLRRKK
jgi:hypothetical protein